MRPSSRFLRLAIAAALMLAAALPWYASPLNTSAQTDLPAKPTGLSALAGDTKVKLTWDPPGDGSLAITSYQLWQLAQNSKLTADITRGNQFGYSVAVDGDTAVIGVYGDGVPDSLDTNVANAGSAYVFTRNTGTGVWSEAAMLTASVPTANDQFGISVAIDGDTVVVGAHQLEYQLGNIVVSRSGAAYVFTRPADGWADMTQTAKLTPGTAGAAGDRFGVSVAVRGGTVVVGAHQHDANAVTDSGAAYVFTKTGTAWASTGTAAKLTAAVGATNDQFGISVAVDGDTVVVGAHELEDQLTSRPGAAYVFTKPVGPWATATETAKLTSGTDGAAGDRFGVSVAVRGDTVVVGAHQHDVTRSGGTALADAGAAYVFTKPVSVWTSTGTAAKLTASDGAANDEFGISVAVDGDTIVVGAHKHDVTPSKGGTAVADAGAAYVFTKPVGPWASTSTAAKLTASDRAANDEFGSSVAVDGDTVMVGAYSHDNGDSNTANSGAVYVFGSWTSIAGSSAAGTTAHLVTGLTNDTTYVFRLRGVNAIEASDPSDSVAGTPKAAFYAPARLLNFSATQTGEGEVELTWDAHRYPLSVTGYAFSQNDGSSWQAISGSDYGTVSHTVTNLDTGNYTFAVSAVNSTFDSVTYEGIRASESRPVAVVDKSAAPDSFSAVAGDGQVWLGWRSPADFTISKYEYQRREGTGAFGGWQEITGSRSGTTFHIVTGLTNGTSYTFRVRAFNAAGGSDSSGEQSATPATASSAPVKPEGFAASQTSVGQVELTWDPSSNPLTVTGYEFTQNNGSTWTTISGSDHSTVSHTLNNLNSGNYTFAIRAVNGPYVGDSSGAQSLAVVAKPAAPTGLTINDPEPGSGTESDIGDTQVRLKWNDPGNTSITKYQVLQFPESIKLISSDHDGGDELGWSVAVDDDTLVIGATGADEPNNTGAAYVFNRGALGWAQVGKLTAAVRGNDAGFGYAVAVHGDTIVVGAYEEDLGTKTDAGAAYVFTRPATGWADMTQTARLTASDAKAEDEFGASVAVHGDTIVVGAPEEATGARGSAYIFTRPANGWADMTETAALRGQSNGDRFGRSVAVHGDTVVVGTPEEGTNDRGEAYVFTKSAATGVWDDWNNKNASNATASLTALDGSSGDYFGRSVAVDGDTIVVGAPYHDYDDPDDNANDVSNSGAAYVFIKTATGGWATDTETAKLIADDGAENDWFGFSVAVDGNTVVVGADQDDSSRGSAYVFTEPQGGWTDTEGTDPLTAYDRSENDRFGNFVAVDGDTVLVGAVGDDSDKGSAYVFGTEGVWADIPGSGAGTTSHIARGLLNNVKHTFRVRAVNAAGEGNATDAVMETPTAATAVPTKPSGFTATQTGVGQVELTWEKTGDPLSITRYAFRQEVTGSGSGTWTDIDGSDSSTVSHTVTGLTTGNTYTFNVQAINSCCLNTSSNEDLKIEAQAAAPTGFTADAGDEQVKLNWTYPGNATIDKYQHFQIDPSKLTATDGLLGDLFGYSVAVDGNTAVIGAYQDDTRNGSAYVFTKVSGVWSQAAKLTASDGAADDEFGYSVAVDGDTIVVGAHQNDPGESGNTISNAGAAYVFTKPASGWVDMTQTAKLTAFGAAADDEFGISVAVDGDTILVGAHLEDANDDDTDPNNNVTDSGAAYVFTKFGGVWGNAPVSGNHRVETAKLIASDAAANDEFGISVALDGDTAVIGARQDDTRNGSAYVFTKVSGVWSQESKLIASDGAANDEFGISVAVNGDTVVVGAYQDDDNGSQSGSAYVFKKPNSGWADSSETAKLTASDGAANDEFGISVAVDGDTVMVGAHQNDADTNNNDEGAAYFFTEPASGWADMTQKAKLVASDAAAGDRYGYSVGVSGDTVVVGAYSDDSNEANTGAAYFLRIPGWTDIPDSAATTTSHIVTGLTNDVEHTFQVRGVNAAGGGLASAGAGGTPTFAIPVRPTGFAVDADDAVVDLSWDDPEDSTIDKYQLLQITQGGKLTTASTDDPVVRGDGFGISVAVDGNTAVVGAYQDDDATNGDNSGSVYVFTRSSPTDPWSWAAKLTADDAAANDEFGISVAVDGDTIVVGAHQDDSSKGAAYLFIKPAGGWNGDMTETAKLTASDAVDNDEFGISVSVDGSTIVVGAHQDDDATNGDNSGSAYVFTKVSGIWGQKAKLTASDAATNDAFGISVSVDGNTIVVGAHKNDSNKGAAYVFTKPTGGWADWADLSQTHETEEDKDGLTAKLTASDAAANDAFGISVAVHSDTVVVGAHKYDVDDNGTSIPNAGSAYVFTKPETGGWVNATETAKLIASDARRGDEFGIAVTIDGDTIVIGAYLDDHTDDDGNTIGNAGSVYVFTGDSNGWSQKTKLTGPSRGRDAWLGHSVAVAGDTVIAGADKSSISGPDSGAVYLWTVPGWADIANSGATTTSHTVTGLTNRVEYTLQVRAVDKVKEAGAGPHTDPLRATPLKPKPAQPTGLSAVPGDTQVRLSWNDPTGGSPPIINYQLWQHAERPMLTADIRVTNDEFGYAVAIDGDTAVVGMPGEDNPDNSGAAFVFTRDQGTGKWSPSPVARLRASDPGTQYRFGLSVAVHEDTSNGDTIVVGAPDHSSSKGAVYVFSEPSGGWANDVGEDHATETARFLASDGAAADEFGNSVAVVSNTIVVGAYLDDDNADSSGSAYVFDEPSGGWANDTDSDDADAEFDHTTETLKLSGSSGSDNFGRSVAIDGDTIVVGASGDDSGTGSAFVFIKPATGWANSSGTEVAKLTAYFGSGSDGGDRFGRSVAIDGGTIVVGAYGDDGDRGSAYVFTKPDTGWANSPGTETAQLTASDRSGGDEFGRSVSVDGDTVVVGAHKDNIGGGADIEGSSYVFTKPKAEWVDSSEAAKLPGPGDSDDDKFGWSVAIDEDTILVGADWHSSNDAGAAYLYDIRVWADIDGSTGETRSHFATGLTNDAEHTFAVRAVNDGGASGPSNQVSAEPASAASAPAKPRNFSAVQVGAREVRLEWEPSTDPLTIVTFEYTDNAGENEIWKDATGSHSTTASYTVSDLVVDTTYTFAARAINSAGEGVSSDPWSVTIAAAPADRPTALTAVAGDEQVQLSWRYSGSQTSITGFQYQQKTGGDFGDDWTDITGSTAVTRSHIVTGLTNDTTYTFRVRAVNVTIGSDTTNEEDATPSASGSRPARPTNFNAEQTGVGQVELTWDTAEARLTVTGYQYTDDGGSNWSDISGSDSGTVYHTVTGLTTGDIFTFAVRSVNSGTLPSLSSVSRDVTIVGEPRRPTGLGATGGDTQATFHWNVTVETTDQPIDKHQLLHLPQSKLTADDRADDDELGYEFGYSVAIDGSTAVVGAYHRNLDGNNNVGVAYVFTKDSDDAWSQAATLTASDGAANDEFGISVAIDGNTIVVGARQDDTRNGAAYVFTRPDGGWTSTTNAAKLTASNGEANDEFGISVAVHGETVVVGAHLDDQTDGDGDTDDDEGAAYVFTKTGAAWTTTTTAAKLIASDGAENDELGISVAIDGDTVVAGAHLHDIDDNAGAAYVFTKPTDGWIDNTEGAKFTAPDGAADDEFGISVAIGVDTVVVGAHLHDVGANTNAGTAYVFTRDSNSGKWGQPLKLTASNGDPGDGFGNSVAVDGNTAVVGAYLDDRDNAARDTGSTYVFARKFGVWSETLNLAGPYSGQSPRLGYSVAVSNDTVLAGVPQDDSSRGSAYAMDISTAEWVDFVSKELTMSDDDEYYVYRVLSLTNDQQYAFRVRSVNAAANRPSAETVAATPMSAKPGRTEGLSAKARNRRVTLSWDDPHDSSLTGYQVLQPTEQTKLTAGTDDAANEEFGGSVAVDDGIAVVGAPEHDGTDSGGNIITDAGAAYVFTRNPNSGEWSGPIELTAGSDGAANDWFGYSVAVDGDTIVVGAYQHDTNDNADAGAAYVFTRDPLIGVWSEPVKLIAGDGAADDWFGHSVAVDGDTIVVGAYGDDGKKGAAYVFTKVGGVWGNDPDPGETHRVETAKLTASGGATFDYFGHSVAVDRDTIVVGAYLHDADSNDNAEGAAYVFTKPALGWGDWSNLDTNGKAGLTTKLTAADADDGDQFGRSVAVDGNTVVVGARKNNTAYVFSSGTWSQAARLEASDSDGSEEFGSSVTVRGSTIVVGADYANIDECDSDDCDDDPRSGAAYLFTKPANVDWSNDPNKDYRTESDKLILPTDEKERGDEFGNSVALDGQSIVVGAPEGNDGFGSVYVSDIPQWGFFASGAETTSATVGGLTNGVEYAFQVRAIDSYGEGLPSNIARATPMPTPAAPNRAPYFIVGSDTVTFTVDENTPPGSLVGDAITATDPDGDVLTYSLSGTDASSFLLDGSTGQITTKTLLDYETQSQYSARVRVRDGQGGIDSIDVSIDVSNVDEAGTVSLSLEQPEVGTPVAASLSDLDGSLSNISWQWARSSDSSDWSDISGANSDSYTPVPDDVGIYLQATASYTDGHGTDKSAHAVMERQTARRGPSFEGDVTLTVDENTPPGSLVGDAITATDPDGHVLTYSLSGTDAASFVIDGSTGQITVGSGTLLDYESGPTRYTVVVSVHDGRDAYGNDDTAVDASIEVSIDVSNVDEAGTVSVSLEQPQAGTALAASLSDPDGSLSNISWQWARSSDGSDWSDISGANSDSYTPVADDVGIYLQATASYTDGHGTGKSAHAVMERQTARRGPSFDPDGPGTGQTAQPAAPNRAPYFTVGSDTVTFTVDENTPPGSLVGDAITATDPDGDVLTYSLSGTDASSFLLDGSTGQITTKTLLDYETQSQYSVRVRVRDDQGGIDSIDVSIDVSNVDEAGTVSLSLEQPEVGTPVAASLSDLDGSLSNISWQWARSSDSSDWSDISGANSDSYTPVPDDVGIYLQATASYTDGHGTDKSAHAVMERQTARRGPSFEGDVTLTVDENTPPGSLVGDAITATDPDGHVLTYSLSGTDAASFVIDGSTGQITVGSGTLLDYESGPTRYTVVVSVHDGRDAYGNDDTTVDASIEVSIDVSNVDEAGTVSVSLEQPQAGTALAASLSDPDGSLSNISWQWATSSDRADWQDTDGASSSTYTPVDLDADKYLRVTASYVDGEGYGKQAQVVLSNPVQGLPKTAPSPTAEPAPSEADGEDEGFPWWAIVVVVIGVVAGVVLIIVVRRSRR